MPFVGGADIRASAILSWWVRRGPKSSSVDGKFCLRVFMRVDNSSEIFLLCIIARLESKDGFPSKQICSSWLKMLQYKTFFASKLIQAYSSQLALRATRYSLLNRLSRHCYDSTCRENKPIAWQDLSPWSSLLCLINQYATTSSKTSTIAFAGWGFACRTPYLES